MKLSIGVMRGLWFKAKCFVLRKKVIIGKNFSIEDKFVFSGPGSLLIGDNVSIKKMPGTRTVHSTVFTHSPFALVNFKNGVCLAAARISCKHFVVIGENSVVEDSMLMDTNFHNVTPDRGEPEEYTTDSAICIGQNVMIGARSIVSRNVIIPDNAEIEPGTVINKQTAEMFKTP